MLSKYVHTQMYILGRIKTLGSSEQDGPCS